MARGDDTVGGSDLRKDRDYLNRRFSAMEQEYSTFEPHYKELTEFIDARRGRYFVTDRNKGDKRYKNIINNKGTRALRKATAGFMAGVMSPSRPWFIWTMADRDLMEGEAVKVWLKTFQRLVLMVVAKSNCYNMSPLMIRELMQFGTGCMTHVDDFDDVARFYTHTVGSYMIAQNSKLSVDTLAREFQMTCEQMVQKWGLNNVSTPVRNSYDNGNYGTWHTVRQFIELNPFRGNGEFSSEFLPFRSVYFEAGGRGGTSDKEKFLNRSGFEGFPAYVPRWELTGEDIYATSCPGMVNLGDIKQLQFQEKTKATAIAKMSTPPLQGPPVFKNSDIHNLPGGVTINNAMGGGKLEAIYQTDPRVRELLFDIEATEGRIDEGFYVDMFMAITDMQGIQPKNELQLSQVNEERLLQLGPALDQVHGEWLERMVRRIAKQILDAGMMPEAPPELRGKELDPEFVSALAMAQRSVTIGGIERTVGFASSLIQQGFDVSDKIDADRALEEYAQAVGSPPKIIVPDEQAAETRRQKQELQSRQAQLDQAEQGAGIMKLAADSKLDTESMLTAAGGQ